MRNQKELLIYFLRLGSAQFGGPVALLQAMREELILNKKWYSEDDFRLGLAISQMAPGPIATQVAIFFGWLTGGWRTALLVAIVFIFPSFFIVTLMAMAYQHFEIAPWLLALSAGASPAVIAVMLKGARKLLQSSPVKEPSFIFFAVISLTVTVLFNKEIIWVFILAALAPLFKNFKSTLPAVFLPVVFFQPIPWKKAWDILQYFFEVGSFVFGSGLVIVPFLYGGVVEEYGWLTHQEFLMALTVAILTPGPIVIAVAFMGYLMAGLQGALLATIGIFLPCYIFVVIFAPLFIRINKNPLLHQSVDLLSACALGAILGGAWILCEKTITSPVAVIILATSWFLMEKTKLSEIFIILGAALGTLLWAQIL